MGDFISKYMKEHLPVRSASKPAEASRVDFDDVELQKGLAESARLAAKTSNSWTNNANISEAPDSLKYVPPIIHSTSYLLSGPRARRSSLHRTGTLLTMALM